MTTRGLITADLNAHIVDSQQVINTIDQIVPVTYRVKEVVILNNELSNYQTPPTVTISSSPTGDTASAAAFLVIKKYGNDTYSTVKVLVTYPGGGYTSPPTVTISGAANNLIASAAIEPDPLVIEKRRHFINLIQTQIAEEALDRSTEVLSVIKDELITIDNHLNRMQSVIEDVEVQDTDEYGGFTEFVSGPHVRTIDTSWRTDSSGSDPTSAISRALMVINLKNLNKLEELRREMLNPTPIP
jgi:hypothetical protein